MPAVVFLITHFELGSCFEKYDFDWQSVFYILPIDLIVKFRHYKNKSLASFTFLHLNVGSNRTF